MPCKVQGRENGTVKCEESLLLVLQCKVVARRSCSWTAKVQRTRTQRTRQAWLAHGACKFYRCERSYSVSLRQLPPRLVRVLLVMIDHGIQRYNGIIMACNDIVYFGIMYGIYFCDKDGLIMIRALNDILTGI